jgi:hypothetical protein
VTVVSRTIPARSIAVNTTRASNAFPPSRESGSSTGCDEMAPMRWLRWANRIGVGASVTPLYLPGDSAVNTTSGPTVRPTGVESVARVASSSHVSAPLLDRSSHVIWQRAGCCSPSGSERRVLRPTARRRQVDGAATREFGVRTGARIGLAQRSALLVARYLWSFRREQSAERRVGVLCLVPSANAVAVGVGFCSPRRVHQCSKLAWLV